MLAGPAEPNPALLCNWSPNTNSRYETAKMRLATCECLSRKWAQTALSSPGCKKLRQDRVAPFSGPRSQRSRRRSGDGLLRTHRASSRTSGAAAWHGGVRALAAFASGADIWGSWGPATVAGHRPRNAPSASRTTTLVDHHCRRPACAPRQALSQHRVHGHRRRWLHPARSSTTFLVITDYGGSHPRKSRLVRG